MTTLNELPPVATAGPATAVVTPPAQPEEDWFKPCAVIPVYNHERSLPAVVAALRAADLPCVLVDDGSSSAAATVIDRLAEQDGVFLLRQRPQVVLLAVACVGVVREQPQRLLVPLLGRHVQPGRLSLCACV